MILRVALIQPNFEGWNFDLRFKKCEKLVKIALEDNPDIICLPELFPGRILKHSKMLWNLNVPIFFGHSIPPSNEGKKWKNCYSLKLPNSEEIQSQEKLVLIVEDEREDYESGRNIQIFNINGVKIGVFICSTLPFGSDLVSLYVDKEIDLAIVPALAPVHHLPYWEMFLVVRAMDLGVPIIFVNYAGYKMDSDGIIYGGGRSSVVLPIPLIDNIQNFKQFLESKNVHPKLNFLVRLSEKEEVRTVDIPISQKWYQKLIRSIKNELKINLKDYWRELWRDTVCEDL